LWLCRLYGLIALPLCGSQRLCRLHRLRWLHWLHWLHRLRRLHWLLWLHRLRRLHWLLWLLWLCRSFLNDRAAIVTEHCAVPLFFTATFTKHVFPKST